MFPPFPNETEPSPINVRVGLPASEALLHASSRTIQFAPSNRRVTTSPPERTSVGGRTFPSGMSRPGVVMIAGAAAAARMLPRKPRRVVMLPPWARRAIPVAVAGRGCARSARRTATRRLSTAAHVGGSRPGPDEALGRQRPAARPGRRWRSSPGSARSADRSQHWRAGRLLPPRGARRSLPAPPGDPVQQLAAPLALLLLHHHQGLLLHLLLDQPDLLRDEAHDLVRRLAAEQFQLADAPIVH